MRTKKTEHARISTYQQLATYIGLQLQQVFVVVLGQAGGGLVHMSCTSCS